MIAPTLLNLLPPEKKKLLNRLYLALYLRIIIEILLLYSLIIAISLILANYLLQSSLTSIQVQTTALDPIYSKINQEIKTANQQLKNVDLAQQAWQPWGPRLAQLFATTSSSISLSTLNLSADRQILLLQGLAKTREALLAFKEQLAQLPWLEEFEIPVSSLTLKENVPFTLTAKLKPSH